MLIMTDSEEYFYANEGVIYIGNNMELAGERMYDNYASQNPVENAIKIMNQRKEFCDYLIYSTRPAQYGNNMKKSKVILIGDK